LAANDFCESIQPQDGAGVVLLTKKPASSDGREDRFGVAHRNFNEDAGRASGFTMALFPVFNGAPRNAKQGGKFLLCEIEFVAGLGNAGRMRRGLRTLSDWERRSPCLGARNNASRHQRFFECVKTRKRAKWIDAAQFPPQKIDIEVYAIICHIHQKHETNF